MQVTYKYKGKPRTYTAPSSMAEMSNEQRLAYYDHILAKTKTFDIVPIFWNIPLPELKGMNEEERHNLLEAIENQYQEEPDFWIITEYKDYLGPANKMETSTWAEFYHASTYINRYRKNKNVLDLRKFLACLYLPTNTEGARQRFNQEKINGNAFASASVGFVYAAILSFTVIENDLKKRFREVFPEKKEDTLEIATTSKAAEPTWLDVTLSMVDTDPVRMEALQEKNMYLVLKSMNLKLEANNKLKDARPNNR